ncbi:hypothetical protein O181_001751 [Austropuccinia psidii MF-1]|uniref:Uncharacterized protein n=1 Tax=Austropuccinia psidii MF-1 TaxID=1389203 RepID=A0A9Q3BBN1_9BASI|nr:hypothetical protein [Austropuccinia psidii MF-1]
MEHGQQEVQPSFKLGRPWSRLKEDMSQRHTLQRSYGNHQKIESQKEVQTLGRKGRRDKGESGHYLSHIIATQPDIEYSDSFSLARSEPKRLPSGFTPFRHQQRSDQ